MSFIDIKIVGAGRLFSAVDNLAQELIAPYHEF